MNKKDIALIFIGMCFGIFICSAMAFLLVLTSRPIESSPSPVPSSTKTFTVTTTKVITLSPTQTITAIPLILKSPTITITPTKIPTIVPTIKPTKTSKGQGQEYPAGVTAICKDGTYSYSQAASGTCSHHGGVKKWIHKP